MESEVKRYERRKHDRRQKPVNDIHPTVYIFLGAFLAMTACWMYVEFSKRFNSGNHANAHRFEEDYDQFRETVLKEDFALRNQLIAKRESRKTNIGSVQARDYYKQRLEKLESDLAANQDFADREGTIGWEIKQRIEQLKSDAPPE